MTPCRRAKIPRMWRRRSMLMRAARHASSLLFLVVVVGLHSITTRQRPILGAVPTGRMEQLTL